MDAHDRQAAERIERVERALEALEGLPDPAAADAGLGAVQAVLEMYAEGLERILAHVGPEQVDDLVGDELVAHLLLLHGLHPVPVEERVARGLDEVRPYLSSHGGGVELMEVADGVARVRLEGTCEGCPSSAVTLKHAVEDAVHRAAPEIERVEAEGAGAPPEPVVPAVMTLPVVQVNGRSNGGAPADNGRRAAGDGHFWGTLDDFALPEGATTIDQVLGRPVLFANVEGNLYAYGPTCPGCGGSLGEAALAGEELTCGRCGASYDLRHAGRSLDPSRRGLDPLPLLAGEAGAVKVAVSQVGAAR